MSKYLLTGGSGTLGIELQKHINFDAPKRQKLDIEDVASMIPFARSRFYSTVVHAAAYTDVPGAEKDNLSVIKANILGTLNVANMFVDSRIVYISTDYVYPGEHGNYKEDDMVRPVNFYGFTKLAGEAFLDPDKDLIIRTSFKPSDLWNTRLDKAFIDIFTSADYVDVVAKDMALAIESNLTGIINIGTERKSIYELAVQRNPEVGKISKLELECPMPRDVSMNIDKFLKLKESL